MPTEIFQPIQEKTVLENSYTLPVGQNTINSNFADFNAKPRGWGEAKGKLNKNYILPSC